MQIRAYNVFIDGGCLVFFPQIWNGFHFWKETRQKIQPIWNGFHIDAPGTFFIMHCQGAPDRQDAYD